MNRHDPPDKANRDESRFSFSPGVTGALIAFVIAVLWMILGFWKLLFILLLTVAGYFVGFRFLRDRDAIRKLIDKILPPGIFR